jgi:histidyl-tRNA synthetase
MNDILPEVMPRWRRLEARFRAHVERYGYGEIRTPIVEPTALFVRSIGEATDIVEKEMYTFSDKAEKSLTLRPEGTASCVRAYLEANAGAKQPVNKWYYLGPMYRRERPAKGRYRQFHQAGCEIYGDDGPYSDAEMIDMVVTLLRDLGIVDVEVLLNSLGGPETRARYREALLAYLAPHREKLSEESRRRLETNPLRVLDSKAPEDQAIAASAPSLLDFLADDDAAHFRDLKATLDRLGTPYRVEPRLVRGLDYYTRTLFEVQGRGGELGAQNALLGGGRYDGMIAELGGPATPAIGFAMGLERLLLAMPDEPLAPTVDVMVLAARPELRMEATILSTELRRAGLTVENDLRGTTLKSQMRRADKLGAKVALIVGDDELARGVVQWKRLVGEGQGEAPRAEIVASLRSLVEAS